MGQIKRASWAAVVKFVLLWCGVVNFEPQFASWATCHLFFFTKERTEAQRGDRTCPGFSRMQEAKAWFKPRPTLPAPNLYSLCMIHPWISVCILTHTHSHTPHPFQSSNTPNPSLLSVFIYAVPSDWKGLYWIVHLLSSLSEQYSFWALVPI